MYVHSENENFLQGENSENSRGTRNSRILGTFRELPYGTFPGGKSMKPYGQKEMGISCLASLGHTRSLGFGLYGGIGN